MRDIYVASKKIFRLLVHGCATVRSCPPLPASLEGEVQVPGFPGVRGWGDALSQSLHESVAEALRQELAAQPGKPAGELALKSEDVLVLSGGGDNGAFGAGLLCGWTEHGDRPAFKLVSGYQYRGAHRLLRLRRAFIRSAIERSIHHYIRQKYF